MVTCSISTKGRTYDTLPITLMSVANQTLPPKELFIFMEDELIDLRTIPIYHHILSILESKGVHWYLFQGKNIGQVANHQSALEKATQPFIWRLDDDNSANDDCLENLMKTFTELESKGIKVGAVGGLVIDPTITLSKNTPTPSNRIENIYERPNIQWVKRKEKALYNVDHLYSSFLFKKEASTHGYEKNLSPVGHREETIFSYEMKRAGWNLYVTTEALTWHLRQPFGGIRSYEDKSFFEKDEELFLNKLNEEWKVKAKKDFWIVLDNGIGDHWAFKSIMHKIREKYYDRNILISCCHNQVFEDEVDATLVSIDDALKCLGPDRVNSMNIYNFMGKNNWTKTLTEAFEKLYEV